MNDDTLRPRKNGDLLKAYLRLAAGYADDAARTIEDLDANPAPEVVDELVKNLHTQLLFLVAYAGHPIVACTLNSQPLLTSMAEDGVRQALGPEYTLTHRYFSAQLPQGVHF